MVKREWRCRYSWREWQLIDKSEALGSLKMLLNNYTNICFCVRQTWDQDWYLSLTPVNLISDSIFSSVSKNSNCTQLSGAFNEVMDIHNLEQGMVAHRKDLCLHKHATHT